MKKTLAAVLAAGALLIGGIGSVDAANWYTVGTDSNGITWSIDNDSVKKVAFLSSFLTESLAMASLGPSITILLKKMTKKQLWTSKLWTTKVTTTS